MYNKSNSNQQEIMLFLFRYKSQAMYGATNGSSPHAETLGGTRLVYCIHGKVNGCCNLSEGEFLYSEKPTISDVSNIIDIQPERTCFYIHLSY